MPWGATPQQVRQELGGAREATAAFRYCGGYGCLPVASKNGRRIARRVAGLTAAPSRVCPPPGHCPDWAQPPRTLRSPPGWGRGQDTDTASGPGCCLPGVPRGSALHEPSPELPSLLIYPWMGNFCSDSVFQLGPPPQDLVPQFTLGTNGIIKLLISLTPLCLLLS